MISSSRARILGALAALALGSCSADGNGGPDCTEATAGVPADLSCTGLFLEGDPAKIAPNARPYVPGVVLWSDGAEKRRYLSLPPSTKIDTTDMDAWKFPVGTKAWKEFRLEGKPIETRYLFKRTAVEWSRATYIWDAAGKTAKVNLSKGPTFVQGGYEIPTALKVCSKCHSGGSDVLLGIEAVALALPTAEGLTLAKLASEGLLSAPPANTSVILPNDASGRGAATVGYLHANCGMSCHSSRALANETKLDMRLRAGDFWPSVGAEASTIETTWAFRTGVGQDVKTKTYADAFPAAKRITPGSHEASVIWQVAHRRGERQMPPIASHKIDEIGTQQLADWIDGLPRQ